ncbi:MAG: hypothetical protein IT304_11500 [Dehalococcoidia bacterium]|nr:hypothetical protein [Dehalococcoidia bacterium]
MSALIGHAGIRRELAALAASAEPPHALLFAGAEGTGRRLLALEYARLLNCEQGPTSPAACDCRSCRRIRGGSHPDVVVLEPGDMLCKPRANESGHEKHPASRDIRICQVRGVIELVARYPFEARYRLIVVDPAERLAREASHTLLKTLEEPPGHTVLALVSATPETLLDTIRSRCRRIEVGPVARRETEEGLRARGVAPETAAAAAAAAHGRPGRAIAFAAQPDLMGDRARLLARCAEVAAARMRARFDYAEALADRVRRDRVAAGGEIDAWEAYWEEALRTAAPADGEAAAGALTALRAVARLRADLLANVQVRPALDLMLLSFPRRTLGSPPQEEPAAHV